MAAGVKQTGPGWRQFRRFLEREVPRDDVFAALDAVGEHLRAQVGKGILTGRPGKIRLRRNKPATIQKKGSSKPLIDTSTMLTSFVNEREEGKTVPSVFVGLKASQIHADQRRNVARVGRFHEKGTVTTLPRRFLKPVLDAEAGRIRAIFMVTMGRKLGFIGPL